MLFLSNNPVEYLSGNEAEYLGIGSDVLFLSGNPTQYLSGNNAKYFSSDGIYYNSGVSVDSEYSLFVGVNLDYQTDIFVDSEYGIVGIQPGILYESATIVSTSYDVTTGLVANYISAAVVDSEYNVLTAADTNYNASVSVDSEYGLKVGNYLDYISSISVSSDYVAGVGIPIDYYCNVSVSSSYEMGDTFPVSLCIAPIGKGSSINVISGGLHELTESNEIYSLHPTGDAVEMSILLPALTVAQRQSHYQFHKDHVRAKFFIDIPYDYSGETHAYRVAYKHMPQPVDFHAANSSIKIDLIGLRT